MARSRLDLHNLLLTIDGPEEVYFQAPTFMADPCIMYEADDTDVKFADNVKYLFKRAYTIIVVDRDPDSPIPDLVEELPYTRRLRTYRANGLNHTAFQMYY